MAKNKGEYDEIRIKLQLIELRDKGKSLKINGQNIAINSVGLAKEFASIPSGVDIRKLSDVDAEKLAKKLGAGKAGGRAKADVNINGIGFSVKSHRSAPAAIVNHTPRWGWVRICNSLGINIASLDRMVAKYFNLRIAGIIGEDVYNNDPNSPFANHKEYLRPLLNYFIFTGTGDGESKFPAKYVLTCGDPYNTNTWQVHDESNYLDTFWDDIKFSMRYKGFEAYPYKRDCDAHKNALSEPWAKEIDKQLKGSLHVRVN